MYDLSTVSLYKPHVKQTEQTYTQNIDISHTHAYTEQLHKLWI